MSRPFSGFFRAASLRSRFLGLTLCVFLVAGAITWVAFERITAGISSELGAYFAQRQVLYDRERILAPVQREIALTSTLAHSAFLSAWLTDETDPQARRVAMTELEDLRTVFSDHSYFLIIDRSLHYYFNDRSNQYAGKELRYTLDPKLQRDRWYFEMRDSGLPYELNVNSDATLNVTKVWINMRVQDRTGAMLGLVGTGIDLTDFVQRVVRSETRGVTNMLIGPDGSIQAHPNHSYITLDSSSKSPGARKTVFQLLGSAADRDALSNALMTLKKAPDGVQTLFVSFEGQPRLLAVAYLPELDWYVVSEMDLRLLIGTAPFRIILAVIGLALILCLLLVSAALDRLVLRRISHLAVATRQVASGDYNLHLPAAQDDELGRLSNQFETMAVKVRDTLTHLEARVAERTAELNDANVVLAEQQEEIHASLRYAKMIQSALLPAPDRLRRTLGETCVMWLPRDIVGGDFYFLFEDAQNRYVGVADCTGHGVPGAFMSMAAYSVIRQVLSHGANAPAAPLNGLIAEIDTQLRDSLRRDQAGLDYGMDLGLCRLTRAESASATCTLEFAGCGIDAYVASDGAVSRLMGRKRGLGYRSRGPEFPVPVQVRQLTTHETVYLPTDGVFDQPGGLYGYGFGRAQFEVALAEFSQWELSRQAEQFERTLREYRGPLAQRDDITLLGFHAPASE